MVRLTVAAVAAVLLAAPSPAAAKRGPVTFAGTCSLAGTLVQDPPITAVPAPGEAFATAAGTCSGTLTDRKGRTREVSDARSRYAASASGVVGCSGGSAEGHGVLTIAGRRIAFAFSEVRGPGGAVISLRGERGGSATGEAHASPGADPAEIAAACAGPGLRSVPIEITLATTPALSG